MRCPAFAALSMLVAPRVSINDMHGFSLCSTSATGVHVSSWDPAASHSTTSNFEIMYVSGLENSGLGIVQWLPDLEKMRVPIKALWTDASVDMTYARVRDFLGDYDLSRTVVVAESFGCLPVLHNNVSPGGVLVNPPLGLPGTRTEALMREFLDSGGTQALRELKTIVSANAPSVRDIMDTVNRMVTHDHAALAVGVLGALLHNWATVMGRNETARASTLCRMLLDGYEEVDPCHRDASRWTVLLSLDDTLIPSLHGLREFNAARKLVITAPHAVSASQFDMHAALTVALRSHINI